MAVDPLAVAAFTVVPFLLLLGGLLFSLWYAITVDRRLVLAAALFVLMGGHQLTEVWLVFTSRNPVGTIPGELFETSVNVLAVGAVIVLARAFELEKRQRERQEVLTRQMSDKQIPGANTSKKSQSTPSGVFNPAYFALPVIGRLLSWAFASLPLGTTATLSTVIETAVRNLQVTYPATEVARANIPDVTVFAEATTLEDVVETVLKQLVIYNDSSEPTIRITVDTDGSRVHVRMSDNGSGLPDPVADQLAGTADDAARPDLALGPVHGLLEKWGGSVEVRDGTVEVTLLRPRPDQAGDPT